MWLYPWFSSVYRPVWGLRRFVQPRRQKDVGKIVLIWQSFSKSHDWTLSYAIFIAIACKESSILVAVHFSMTNIYQSYDLGRAVGRGNVDISQ